MQNYIYFLGLAGGDECTKATADMLVQCIEVTYVNYKPYVMAFCRNDEQGKLNSKFMFITLICVFLYYSTAFRLMHGKC